MLTVKKSLDYIEKSACVDAIWEEQLWSHLREKTTEIENLEVVSGKKLNC